MPKHLCDSCKHDRCLARYMYTAEEMKNPPKLCINHYEPVEPLTNYDRIMSDMTVERLAGLLAYKGMYDRGDGGPSKRHKARSKTILAYLNSPAESEG